MTAPFKWAILVIALILLFLSYLLGRASGKDEVDQQLKELTEQIKVLDLKAETLQVQRDSARAATAKTKPAVVQGRAQVTVISPGVLEIKVTPSSETQRVTVDSIVTFALTAERHRVDSLEAELNVADEQLAVAAEQITKRDEKIALLEKERNCKILWLVNCPSRKTAAAIGAVGTATVIIAAKIILPRI